MSALGLPPAHFCLSYFRTSQPEEMQRARAQAPGPAETPVMALVQSVPGVHPVPIHAYSIKDASCREVRFSLPPDSAPGGPDPTGQSGSHLRSQALVSTYAVLSLAPGCPARKLPCKREPLQGRQRPAESVVSRRPVCVAAQGSSYVERDTICVAESRGDSRSKGGGPQVPATQVHISAHHPSTPEGC